MASRAERFKKAAVKAAKTARKWAATAAREADRLLAEAQKRAATEQRQRCIKEALRRTGKVLKAVGRAAIVAGIAGGFCTGRVWDFARGSAQKGGGLEVARRLCAWVPLAARLGEFPRRLRVCTGWMPEG